MLVTVRHLCQYCKQPCGPETIEEHTDELIALCKGDVVSHGICPSCFEKHFPTPKGE